MPSELAGRAEALSCSVTGGLERSTGRNYRGTASSELSEVPIAKALMAEATIEDFHGPIAPDPRGEKQKPLPSPWPGPAGPSAANGVLDLLPSCPAETLYKPKSPIAALPEQEGSKIRNRHSRFGHPSRKSSGSISNASTRSLSHRDCAKTHEALLQEMAALQDIRP